jgi:nitroreductase
MTEREPLSRGLEALLARRKSARSFRPEPISEPELRALFAAAQHAPSWCNIQPWRVTLTAPALTRELASALRGAALAGAKQPEVPFPAEYPEPYDERRRACGYELYRAMAIARDDTERRREAWLRNFEFFGAPHAAIVCQDRRLGPYAGVDIGVWLGYLLALAEARGIDTCPMASIAAYPAPLRRLLGLDDHEVVLFAVALGRSDTGAANACRTERAPVDACVRFVGFPKPADANDVLEAFARGEAPPLEESPSEHSAPSLGRAEWEHIQRVLTECGGNIRKTARRLGIHRRTLQRKLEKYPPNK